MSLHGWMGCRPGMKMNRIFMCMLGCASVGVTSGSATATGCGFVSRFSAPITILGDISVPIDGEQRLFRTDIDTGAVYGGALTSAMIDSTTAIAMKFLQVGSFD